MFVLSNLVFLALSAATSAVSVNAQGICARNTTVHLGETCDIISEFFNVSTSVKQSHSIRIRYLIVCYRYQLAFVNQDKIDAACDNLAVGEVYIFLTSLSL